MGWKNPSILSMSAQLCESSFSSWTRCEQVSQNHRHANDDMCLITNNISLYMIIVFRKDQNSGYSGLQLSWWLVGGSVHLVLLWIFGDMDRRFLSTILYIWIHLTSFVPSLGMKSCPKRARSPTGSPPPRLSESTVRESVWAERIRAPVWCLRLVRWNKPWQIV